MTPGGLSDRQRWDSAAGRDLHAISSSRTPLLRHDAPIAVVGGQLAAALIAPLTDAGFPIVAAERRHSVLAPIPPEAAEYEAFGSGYGEVHTARAFRQLVERAARTFSPAEDRWSGDGAVIDPFRPDLRYPAASDREFDVLQERYLNAVRSAFRRAGTVLVALSAAEVWEASADGAVFPHFADHSWERFAADRHGVRLLGIEETAADLSAAVASLRSLNPAVDVVLMISPEPLRATGLPLHVAEASSLGKAVLRLAAQEAAARQDVRYFPALEIAGLVGGGSNPVDGVTAEVAAAVADALLANSQGGARSDDEDAPAVTVLPADRAAAVTPPTPVVEPAPAKTAEVAPTPKGPKPAEPSPAKPAKRATVAVVDAYTTAKAKEDAEKAARRAALRATDAPNDRDARRAEKRAAAQAAREAKAAEAAAAREAKAAKAVAGAEAREAKAAEAQAARDAKGAGARAAREARAAGRARPPAAAADWDQTGTTRPRPRRVREEATERPREQRQPRATREGVLRPLRAPGAERPARRIRPLADEANPSTEATAGDRSVGERKPRRRERPETED